MPVAAQPCDIGFVGAGVMGKNLIMNLVDNGFRVIAFDLDQSKLEALQAQDDAASFVASQGEIRGAFLEIALRHTRTHYPTGEASDMQLAQAMLAR